MPINIQYIIHVCVYHSCMCAIGISMALLLGKKSGYFLLMLCIVWFTQEGIFFLIGYVSIFKEKLILFMLVNFPPNYDADQGIAVVHSTKMK